MPTVKTSTPLNDFVMSLADPSNLDLLECDPRKHCERQGLSEKLTSIVLMMHGGTLRINAMRELEQAGLAPLVTDQFPFQLDGDTLPPVAYMNSIFPENTTTNNVNTSVDTVNYNNYTAAFNENSHNTTQSDQYKSAAVSRIMESIDTAIAHVPRRKFAKPGRLTIVGSGIRSIVDLTIGAEAQIKLADRVFYTVADPVTEKYIHDMNSQSKSLYDLYGNDKPRMQTYREMVAVMLQGVSAGEHVCGVFYGHPGVFAWPTHEAIRQARAAGYRAEMMPGISADACLFADLGIDPSYVGYQTFEATELLINQRKIDTGSHVVIWQVECVGDEGFNFSGYRKHNFSILIEYIQEFYEKSHPVVIYEASMYPHLPSSIRRTNLDKISKDDLTGICTLYLPPMSGGVADGGMIRRLGLG